MTSLPSSTDIAADSIADRVRRLELELEQSQKERAQLQERYQLLLESITDYVYSVQVRNGQVTETHHSAACAAVTGYTTQDFANDPSLWIQMVHPADRELVLERAKRVLHGEQVAPIEHRILHKTGSHRWVNSSFVLHRDAEGRITRYDGIVRDITEHKRNALALSELREHQQRAGQLLTTILSNTFMAAVYLDTEFNYLWVNEAYAKHCARPTTFFPGKNLFALYPQLGSKQHFAQVVKSGEPLFGHALPLDFVDQPERGTTYWDYSLYPITDGSRTIVGLVLTLAEVTSRVRVEEQLRSNELRYRTVANYTYDWEYWETPEGRLAYCSPSCLRVTGHRPEEFLETRNFLETLVHPDDVAQFRRFRKEIAYSRGLRELDFRITRPDGTIVWLSQRCSPVTAEDGSHLGWRASTRDITDRKQSELQQRTLAELLNLSPVCVTVHDDAGRFSYANQKALDLHGYTRDEFMNLRVPELRTIAQAPSFYEQVQHIRTHGSLRFQTEHQHKDGHTITLWTEAQATIVDGNLKVLSVATDITDQERARRSLAESESTLRAFFEAVNDAIFIMAPDGTIIVCNHVAAARFNQKPEALFGTSIYNLIGPELGAQRRRYVEQAAKTGKPLRFEDIRSGRHIEHSLYPIVSANGTMTRLAIFSRDTTESRLAEARLRRTNEILLSLRDAQSQFMMTGDPQSVYQTLLSALVELTQSSFGYLEKVSSGDSSTPLISMSADELVPAATFQAELVPHLRRLKSSAKPSELLLSGDQELPASVTSPEMHGTLRSFIGIPLVYGGEIVGVVGLANRSSGYNRSLVETLAPFTSTCAATIHAVETMRRYREQGAQLRDTEEAKRAIVETVPGAVFRFRIAPNFPILHFSSGITDLLGYSPSELLSKDFDWWSVISQQEANRIHTHFNTAIANARPVEVDVQARDKSGCIRWIHVKAQATAGVSSQAEYVDGVAIDVTERKQTEEALAHKSEELDHYFDTALDLLCIADTLGGLRRVNSAWEETLGYALHELEGRQILDLVHPDDTAATERALSCLSIQDQGQSFISRLKHMDGTYRHVEWRARLQDSQIYAVARDISDRVRAEQTLKESESRFRALVENTPDVISQLDLDGKALYVSPAIEKIFHIPAEQLLGKTFAAFGTNSIVASLWQARIDRVIRTGKPDEAEVNLELGTRGSIIINSRLCPVFGAQGVSSILGLVRDVTEQKRLEREYQALFNEMLSGLAIFEVISDADAQAPEFRVLAVNPAFERMLGRDSDDLFGRTLQEILPTTASQWSSIFSGVAQTGTPSHFESAIAEIGRLFEVTGFRTSPQQVAGIFVDISDRRRVQEQLHQSTKLEAIGRLASGVAHDLNNLLMPILGYADAAIELIEPDNDIGTSLREIRSAGLQAKDLVRQLLSFGRKQHLEIRVVDLCSAVTSFAKLLERAIRENIQLSLVTPTEPLWIRADLGQVELILMNLAVNAQDAMPNGGKLSIEIASESPRSSVFPESMIPEPQVLLIVRDDGVGMDSATRERIFEPFFATNSAARNVGLGLAAVHSVVMQHGATISVNSAPGEGTEYVIRFPAAPNTLLATSDTESPPSHSQPRAQASVLVVEDNPLVRDLATRALESQGYRVRAAANAKECLASLSNSQEKVDLLLTDMVMPDMSGKALYEVLAARFATLKVAYMSGYSQEFISQQHGLGREATFLQKPFSMRRLIATVRRLLESEG